ncbi:MAG TPA: phage tail protein, partial [Arenibaculum sp.]|nr:phage tail protein [Arenibaculum sp.]
LYVAAAQTATVTLDENDIIGRMRVQARRSRRDLFNAVRGVYVSPVNQYQPGDFPPLTNATYQAQDSGERIWQDIELPYTDSPSMAQRLAKVALERNRQQITVECRCKLTAFRLQAGLWVRLSNARRGWDRKLFEVQRWQLVQETDDEGNPMLAVDLSLQEIAAGVYDWNNGEETTIDPAPDTNLPDPWTVAAPAGLALSSGTDELLLAGDGTVVSRIRVEVAPASDAFVARYEVQYKRSTDARWADAASLTGGQVGYIAPVTDRAAYDVRARSVSVVGVPSPWVIETGHIVVGKTAPPSGPTQFAATVLPYGILLRWQAVPDADVATYVIRLGTVWETATPVAEVRGNTYAWEFRTSGTYTLLIKAVDTSGNASFPATSTVVTIDPPAGADPVSVIEGPNAVLSWPEVTGRFAIAEYEIRHGDTWDGGTLVNLTKATAYTLKATWGGSRRFWVAAIDVAGNVGPPASVDVVIQPAGRVSSLQPQVIDNTVLLRWTAPTSGSLPVDHYRIRRGASFATAEPVGQQAGTFATIFEDVAGAYAYWVAAVDTAGTVGEPRSVPVTVDQPPDYVLRTDAALPLPDAASANALVAPEGNLLVPVLAETWQGHFASRGWTSPQDQIDAGYPLYIQPTASSGSWRTDIDYGTTLAGTRISVSIASAIMAGAPDMSVTVSTSPDGTAWTDYPGLTQVFATAFRYVRVRLDVTVPTPQAVLSITEIRVKLDAKLIDDAGSGTAAASDGGGTVMTFTRPFIDVTAITVNPAGTTPRIAVYDFTDVPNPTQFKVFLFDTAGNRVSGPFSWSARGY